MAGTMVSNEPVPPWQMRGELVGVCNCDWGCPCNFDAPPTYGYCDGLYARLVHEGRYGDVSLDGVRFVSGGHSPGPIHEGGAIDVLIVDSAVTREQRAAIERLDAGGGVGEPFDIFASLRAELLPIIVAPIEFEADGIRSKVRVAGGDIVDIAVGRIPNPVTGEQEEVYVDKPTGFTATRSELGTSLLHRYTTRQQSWNYPNRYAEYCRFDYSGPP
jgi:hypothetical protein